MSDSVSFGFVEAARRLGVPVRVLRAAIRAGRVPAPPQAAATAALPAAWLEGVQAAAEASPKALSRARAQKVAPFARYEGTSAWRKYTNRVREYNAHQAATGHAAP